MTHPLSSPADLLALAERVEKAGGFNNDLDVQCEIALFEPCVAYASIRANAAGTKTICTEHNGRETTFLARDFTMSASERARTAAALKARALSHKDTLS